MADLIKQIKIGSTTYDVGENYYHSPSHTSGTKIATGNGVNDLYVPEATGTTAGVTVVYPAASCTSYTSDKGTCTPLAVQNGVKQFGIPRPNYNATTRKGSATDKAITRYSGTEGDVQDSKIIIEDVTNTKDTSKKAQVIAIPAEGGKKMVYGYCTDQVDGTSFIGGIFDQSATSYPYAEGLAIGGTSGNLLWKGKKVLTVDDSYVLPTASSTLGGVKTTSTVTSTSGLTACPIISGVVYYKDTNTTYTHPTTSGNKHIPSGGSSGQILRWSADGTAVWGADNNTTYSAATTSAAGLMSAADKTKLDGIATGANKYSLPTASSSTLGGVKIGTGIAISSGVISNSGVRSIATGTSNGTISVNTNGTSANVAVKGLGSAAYTASTAYAPASHSHDYLTGWADTRNVTTTPNDYNSQLKVVGIKTPTASGTLDGSSYSTLVGVRGWSDSSGGNSHELAFTGFGSLYRRHGSTTSWSDWIQVLDSSNYTSYCAKASHTHSYLPLSGGTMTGSINAKLTGITKGTAPSSAAYKSIAYCDANGTGTSNRLAMIETSVSTDNTSKIYMTAYQPTASSTNNVNIYVQYKSDGTHKAGTTSQFYGAVWNDYAEYRDQDCELKPGYITYCDDDGKLKYATERLQHFEGVVSDTFGFAIGETDNCRTPLAVSGRVLVYCDPEDRFHAGDCVCAGPKGIAYRMTREEIIEFPDRIVGTVSEIPTYETWGSGNVSVNGRIWIKVR